MNRECNSIKVIFSLFFLAQLIAPHDLLGEVERWAHVYRKLFSSQEIRSMGAKKTVVWPRDNKEPVALFSQLIFSWNAVRPARGYFSFAAQVRDARTKQWGSWHTMIDWGADRQRSYTQKATGISGYYHVRLELNKGLLADAFRVRIDAHDGASLDSLRALFASVADFSKFKSESINAVVSLPSVSVAGVPVMSQFLAEHERRDALCSPTSVAMLAQFVTSKQVDITELAQRVFDVGLDAYGSWPFNTAHLFEQIAPAGYAVVCRLNSFAQLHAQLQRGAPVIVSVRGSIAGAPKSYENGHLLLVVGWDKRTKEVICHDPAAKKLGEVVRRYAVLDFVSAWERSRRLAYLLEIFKGE